MKFHVHVCDMMICVDMKIIAQMSELKIDYMFMCSTRNCYMIKIVCVEREIVIYII